MSDQLNRLFKEILENDTEPTKKLMMAFSNLYKNTKKMKEDGVHHVPSNDIYESLDKILFLFENGAIDAYNEKLYEAQQIADIFFTNHMKDYDLVMEKVKVLKNLKI